MHFNAIISYEYFQQLASGVDAHSHDAKMPPCLMMKMQCARKYKQQRLAEMRLHDDLLMI